MGEGGGGMLASERLRVADSRPRSTPAATDGSRLVALTLGALLLGGFDCKVPETSRGQDWGNGLSKPWEQLAPSRRGGEGRGGLDPPSALAPRPLFLWWNGPVGPYVLTFLGNVLQQYLAQPPCVEGLCAFRSHGLQGGGQRGPREWVVRTQGFRPIEEELPGGWGAASG